MMTIEQITQEAADAWHRFDSATDNREYLLGYYQAKLNTLESMGGGFGAKELDLPFRFEYLFVSHNRHCPECGSRPSELWIYHDKDCTVVFPSS